MSRVEIIAECGINHGGSLERATELARAAKQAGADVAKFQTYIPEKVLRRSDPDFDAIFGCALSFGDTILLAHRCGEMGIEFMSTPGDVESLRFLVEECRVKRLKIGSDDLTNRELVGAAYATGLPVILSTGMARIEEIVVALPIVARSSNITLLHCTSLYPCPPDAVNLLAMTTLRDRFGLPVGYSDHTAGYTAPIVAAALGACMIEKHLKLVGTRPIDDDVSLDSGEFRFLVELIRQTEAMLGDGDKRPGELEAAQVLRLRKGADGLRGIAA